VLTTNNKRPDPFYHIVKLTYPPNCFGLPKSLAPGDYLCTRRYTHTRTPHVHTAQDGMPGMKTDMGGSGAVLCAFVAAVRRGALARPLAAILCCAENSVAANATRPDDVHVLYR
jgi:Cytosol aminopeptidase family, catalytic domain